MIDLKQWQLDVTQALLSAPLLANVQVKSYRQMREKQEIDYRTVLTTPRNGKVGAGAIVLMPSGIADNTNVTGPIMRWSIGVVAIEQDDLNMSAIGTGLTAEDVGLLVLDAMHLDCDQSHGTLFAASSAMGPEAEYTFPGCIAYRVTLTLSAGKNIQTPRCALPQVSIAGGMAALACSTAGADVRYTLDGSFPTSNVAGDAANASSVGYTAPFAVASGQTLRVAAYADGFNKSTTLQVTIP